MTHTLTHTTHCCPLHGCKYGWGLSTDCPVETGMELPDYPRNNGCEQCEYDSGHLTFNPTHGAIMRWWRRRQERTV